MLVEDSIRDASPRRGSPLHWRVLLGAALVTVAAGGVVFAHRAAQQPPATRYLVVTDDIAAGEVLAADKLGSVAIDLPGGVDAIAEESADDVTGRVATQGLAASTLLSSADLADDGLFTTADEKVVAISVDPARFPADDVEVGDLVHLLGTDQSGTELLTGARVAGISSDEESAIGGGSGIRVSLGVADLDTSKVVADAAVNQAITIVVPSPAHTEAP